MLYLAAEGHLVEKVPIIEVDPGRSSSTGGGMLADSWRVSECGS